MVYIKSATQISAQQPLSEAWMTEPQILEGTYLRSQDPAFREWLNPMESRRLGKLLKRALVTATEAMTKSGITQPDAVITGTGLGCIENTELLLNQMCREGDDTLKPTNFMQSTHNTISSLIAINSHCHGYNSTYSHKAISFDRALHDAFLQMSLGDIGTALVTGNDEMTPSFFTILQRAGYLGQPGQVPATEASMAMMLSTEAEGALCELKDIRLTSHHSSLITHHSSLPDAILIGTNGCETNDSVYVSAVASIIGDLQSPPIPLLHYKHLFGEGYCSSALGVYAAAHIVSKGEAPAFMRCDGHSEPLPVSRLLIINHSDGNCFSYITLHTTK